MPCFRRTIEFVVRKCYKHNSALSKVSCVINKVLQIRFNRSSYGADYSFSAIANAMELVITCGVKLNYEINQEVKVKRN